MILRPDDPEFWKALAKIYSNNYIRAALYTNSAAQYYRERPLNEGKNVEDKSFVLIWESEPVIAFQGALVKSENSSNLLFYEIPASSIEDKKRLTNNSAKTFLREFDQIIESVNGVIWVQDYLPNGELSTISRHLLSKGAIATPVFSQVIDLNQSQRQLKSSIRKSYGSLINWGLRELNPVVHDAASISWGLIDCFRNLHIREAGRETRSESSWRRQFEMIKADEAFAIFGYIKEELVSAGLFNCSKSSCYYSVSASRRDLFNKPLFHSLIWKAILYAKELGCHWFEIGDQAFPNHPQQETPTQKELGISQFKAGFGGATKVLLDLKLEHNREE